MKIGIIADDLAGANQAAAVFRRRGLNATVLLDWADKSKFSLVRAEVVALDTETRHATPSEAASQMREAANFLKREGVAQGELPVILKQVDSTLRGQIGAELEALLGAYPGRMAIFAPSFPEYKHTVDLGHLYSNGQPLEETSLAENATPSDSSIANIIAQNCNRRSAPVGLGLVRGGSMALATAFEDLAANGVEIAICDALETADLEAIAHVLLRQPAKYLAVGSAGLAGALVNHLAPHGEKSAPALIVNGSLHPRSLNQNQYLIYHWKVGVVELDLDWVLHGGESARLSEIARCLQEIQQNLMAGIDTILATKISTAGSSGAPQTMATREAELVGNTLGEVVAEVCSVQATRQIPLAGIVLVGGHTASSVCRQLGAKTLAPHSEVLPGIAAAYLEGSPYPHIPIITKPASLGPDYALAECARYLKRGLD